MQDSIYVILSVDGARRMTKKPPTLAGGERAVQINLSVDDSVFEYSFMKTDLTIKEDDIIEPSMEIELEHSFDKL